MDFQDREQSHQKMQDNSINFSIDNRVVLGLLLGLAIAWLFFGRQQQQLQQSSQTSRTMIAAPYQNQPMQNQLYQSQLQNQLYQNSLQSQQSIMYNQDPLINSQYKNAEVWEVERSSDGFISKVKADRDAKVGTMA